MAEPGLKPKQFHSGVRVLHHDASKCCRTGLWLKELNGCKSYFQWLMYFKSTKYLKALYILTHKTIMSQSKIWERQSGTISNIYWMITLQAKLWAKHLTYLICLSICSPNNPSVSSWTLLHWEALEKMILQGSLHFWKPYNHWRQVLARRHFNVAMNSHKDSFLQNSESAIDRPHPQGLQQVR